jgi:hypothetical protein
VRVQVVKELTVEVDVFWYVTPCGLVEVYRLFTESSINQGRYQRKMYMKTTLKVEAE